VRRSAAPAASAAAALPAPSSAGAAARDALLARLRQTPDRGIFGLPARSRPAGQPVSRARAHVAPNPPGRAAQETERAELDALVRALESEAPLAQPTASLAAVAGDWSLLYTTARRTCVPARRRLTRASRSPSAAARAPSWAYAALCGWAT
jgi:hypothetical protein